MTGARDGATDPDDREEAVEGGEDGHYPPRPCVVCGDETILRCGGCHGPICHHHGPCPHGCDDPVPDTLPFGRRPRADDETMGQARVPPPRPPAENP
ncbi:MAG: hypothetical protein AB7H88_02160 [Vicinamibacterales bacterium]